MLFVKFDETNQILGYLGLFSLFIIILLSSLTLLRAIRTKNKLLYIFFLVVLLTPSPWYPSTFGFIYWLITSNILNYEVYLLLGILGTPIAVIGWIYIYMTIVKPDHKDLVLAIYIIFSIFFYIYLFYFLYFAPDAPVESMLGIKNSPLDITHRGLILIYLFVTLITSGITGIHFSLVSMKSDKREVQWKGKFLLVSFILFEIGAVGDGFFDLSLIFLLIFRLLLTISSIFFFIGFVMPNWMRKLLSL